MLKEAKAHVTRVRALDQLHRGDEIEARLRVGPNYDDVVIRRGSVQETAPGIGVVWIMDRHTGHAQGHQRGRMQRLAGRLRRQPPATDWMIRTSWPGATSVARPCSRRISFPLTYIFT